MAIKQSRYITADTTGKKEMAIRTTELDKVKDDPYVRKSEVQQTVNNSTLPVSSRAVNLAINSIELPSLDGYATEEYVDEGLESVGLRVDLIDEKATEAKAEADRAEQAVSDAVGTGRLMREGAYGVGSTISKRVTADDLLDVLLLENGFFRFIGTVGQSTNGGCILVNSSDSDRSSAMIMLDMYRSRASIAFNNKSEVTEADIYTSINTTVDSNGFIKQASPIIKLFDDHIEANDSFKEKPEFEKLGTGVYQISGTLGLAKEGWYIETPRDRNGFPYFLVEWEQDENNVVTIRTFKRKIDLETLDFVNGDPVDIREDQRWIDLRFHEETEEVEDGGV